MNDDHAWDRIVDAIDSRYGITTHGRTTRPVDDNHELTEQVAFITFSKDGQELKIERIKGPAIVDRKTIGARRAGATMHYQNVYDPSEISFRTVVFRKNETGEWEEVGLQELGLGQ